MRSIRVIHMRSIGFVTLGVVLGLVLLVDSLLCPAMAGARYSVSPEGVIKDSKTGLEWVVGPDKAFSYDEAVAWVKDCKIAGGGWRMPTAAELVNLYAKGLGKYGLDSVFNASTSDRFNFPGSGPVEFVIVWHNPDSLNVRYTNFPLAHVLIFGRNYGGADGRSFGVRFAKK